MLVTSHQKTEMFKKKLIIMPDHVSKKQADSWLIAFKREFKPAGVNAITKYHYMYIVIHKKTEQS